MKSQKKGRTGFDSIFENQYFVIEFMNYVDLSNILIIHSNNNSKPFESTLVSYLKQYGNNSDKERVFV